MKYYTAKDLSELTGLQSRQTWRDVKCRGIAPGKAHNVLVLTQEQLDLYTQRRAAGYQEKAVSVSPWRDSAKARNDIKRQLRTDNNLVQAVAANGRSYLVAPAAFEVPAPYDWRGNL